MEMQFDKIPVAYLKKLTGQLRSQEQTLEVRLPDGLPDIGKVLGAWGQVIVRSKEWSSDAMGVSCGVMVWVLYMPEDEDGARSVQAWLPFSMKWDLPDTRHDGKILVSSLLRSVDARSTSARKLMVRASLDALGEAWLPAEEQIAVPGELPQNVELLTAEYPMLLPREAGEKAFVLEEQIDMPEGGARPEKLLYYMLQPEILDKKVMAGKVVFRGSGLLRFLYRGEDGKLYNRECELPFSQYGELEGEYSQNVEVSVFPCVTSLDLSVDENGALQLKAGLLGQYLLWEWDMIAAGEDAYGTQSVVKPVMETLQLPAVLEQTVQTIHWEHTLQGDVQQLVNAVFLPEYSQPERTGEDLCLPVAGQLQILYYDGEEKLRSASAPWKGEWKWKAAEGSPVDVRVQPVGKIQATPGVGGVILRGDLTVDATAYSGQGIPMVAGVEIAEPEKTGAARPSLILCRKGDRRLWDVAKQTGSTVAAIKAANGLDGEPESNRVLLIPIS